MFVFYRTGHDRFFKATLTLVFAPSILSFFIEFLVPSLNDVSKGDFQGKVLFKRLSKTLCHLPFIQVIRHFFSLIKLTKFHKLMSQAVEEYKLLDLKGVMRLNNTQKIEKKKEVDDCAQKYHTSRDSFKKYYCKSHEAQLYDKFGEDAPQFVLQLAIVLTFGYVTWLQTITIITSFLGFVLGSINIYTQIPTKYSEVREKKWQDNVILGCFFVFIILSRFISLCLAIAYMKAYIFLGLLAYIVLSLSILWLSKREAIRNDPRQSTLGVITNIFSPCIAVNEYDNFLLFSSLISTICHLLLQICLFLSVFCQLLQPMPNPPVTHCFFDETSVQSIERCPFTTSDNISFSRNGPCIPLITPYALNEPTSMITFCPKGMQEWTLLAWTCGITCVFLLLNIPFSYFLQWYLSPIWRYKVSSKYCCFGSNLKREYIFIAPFLNKLFKEKSKENYQRVSIELQSRLNGKSLLQWALEEKHFLFAQHLLEDYKADIKRAEWEAVCGSNRVEGLNIVLEAMIKGGQGPNEFQNENEALMHQDSIFSGTNPITSKALKNHKDGKRIQKEGEFWKRLGDYLALQLPNEHEETDVEEPEVVPPSVLYGLQKLAKVSAQEGVQTCSALKLNASSIWMMEEGRISDH